MEDTNIFWDRKTTKEEARVILSDEQNPRFIEFASLLLSRSNDPRMVFNNYISKERFYRNWAKIKRLMRRNKWNDTRIIFWDEINKAVRKSLGPETLALPKRRPLVVDPAIKEICEEIRRSRKGLGLTQQELAARAGLSQQSISFAEQGYVNISLQTLIKIAGVLKLKVSLNDAAK